MLVCRHRATTRGDVAPSLLGQLLRFARGQLANEYVEGADLELARAGDALAVGRDGRVCLRFVAIES
jgi:hypothetical protein